MSAQTHLCSTSSHHSLFISSFTVARPPRSFSISCKQTTTERERDRSGGQNITCRYRPTTGGGKYHCPLMMVDSYSSRLRERVKAQWLNVSRRPILVYKQNLITCPRSDIFVRKLITAHFYFFCSITLIFVPNQLAFVTFCFSPTLFSEIITFHLISILLRPCIIQ